MSLATRLPHLSAEQLTRYERMLANSPPLPCRAVSRSISTDLPLDSAASICIHRGDAAGTVSLRLCCGQKAAYEVDAFACEFLNCRCVQVGTPAERGVETCSTCGEFRHSK